MKSNGSRKPTAREIEFDADALLQSLRGHADHLEGRKKLTLRVTRLVLPPAAPKVNARQIATLRSNLRVSQPVFASLLNVPLATARSWEQGRRKPSGAALRLLDLARRHPRVLLAEA